ncbi:unnamed protein product [Blepharisma stoltei]|uniref:Uncharacterized protein n=1 Tax=Blepharisma stoltei TaxID=1481888 RepID=A0AAU9JF48_9CILI|nr:unnamed protein product [Blepharisma stoltei]
MAKYRCSEDSYDAIYICSCTKMQCIKHFYSHIKDFPDHSIERIKIPVNNESRKILIKFVIAMKQMPTLYFKEFNKECIKNPESYKNFLFTYNDSFDALYACVCKNTSAQSIIFLINKNFLIAAESA